VRKLVVVPTYNERENVGPLVRKLLGLGIGLEVLVVDDNSPDGTGEVAEGLSKIFREVHVLHRGRKEGLGRAYVAGFRYALEHGYDIIIQMDADFSHDPEYVPKLLEKLEEGYDLVLGSRYINGVNVVHWPMKRLLLSYLANWYSRKVTGMPVRDATGGFKVFRRKVLESLDLDRISASGYAFQIETTFRAWLRGFKVCEVPIVFWERRWGESKMRFGIAWEAVWLVWKLRLERCFRRLGWTSR